MGFFLTVLYLVASFLTPPVIFGPLAEFRIELILAVLLLLVSVPKMMRSFVFRTPQALALAGLSVAASFSVFIAMRWLGGAINTWLGFIPSIYAYFLVCLHCDSRKKLQLLVIMLLFVCLFVIVNGALDLRHVTPTSGFSGSESSESAERRLWEIEHPYLFPMQDDAGQRFYRLRGLGEVHDPNDFGQLLVCEIPLLFVFWRPKKLIRNFAFVMVPASALSYGIYLTHSRGALLALVAVVLVAARRRIGTLPAAVIAAGLFAGAMAVHFTGGRAISAEAGADRTELWSESLQIVKSHPIFGIGLNQLPGYIGHTAHNSIVVCAAELGLFGLYFWSLFLLPTVRDTLVIASPKRVADVENAPAEEGLLPFYERKSAVLDKAETNRLGYCLLLSLTGFLAAGWFLSRAFVMTLFLLGGMAEVVYEMALRRGMTPPRLSLGRVLIYSVGLMIGSLTLVYVTVRILNLAR
jgi:hypothetical protein